MSSTLPTIDPNGAIYRIVSALTCDLTLDYSDDILNLNLELGTPEPVTWNLWVSIQNAVIKVWSLPLPVVTPPISSDDSRPGVSSSRDDRHADDFDYCRGGTDLL